jgi:uncharacterized protein (DUF302 family)
MSVAQPDLPGDKTASEAAAPAFARHTQVTRFATTNLTIHSKKSFFEVTSAIESALPRLSMPRLFEFIGHQDRAGFEAYVDRVSRPFSIFWELEQGTAMRLAGIPVESKFYLVGNPVIARGLFSYTPAAGLGAPVRVCVSQPDGGQTRIDMELPSAFFSRFPEMKDSPVPAQLDEKMVTLFQDIAAS